MKNGTGQRLLVESRLATVVLTLSIDAEDNAHAFTNLFAAVDAEQKLEENGERNNALDITRNDFPDAAALAQLKYRVCTPFSESRRSVKECLSTHLGDTAHRGVFSFIRTWVCMRAMNYRIGDEPVPGFLLPSKLGREVSARYSEQSCRAVAKRLSNRFVCRALTATKSSVRRNW